MIGSNEMLSGGDFFAGLLVGWTITILLVAIVARRRRLARPPRLAGSPIPELGAGIDLTRRYDVTCSGHWGETINERFENVQILGYVGQSRDLDISKAYMPGRWLVLEHRDGRRSYLMPSSISCLRESATSSQSS